MQGIDQVPKVLLCKEIPQMLTNDFQVPSEPITVRYFLTWWSNQSCGHCWHLGSWNQKWNIVRVARNFLTQCVKKSSIFSNLHHNHIYSNHNPNLNHNQYLKYLLFKELLRKAIEEHTKKALVEPLKNNDKKNVHVKWQQTIRKLLYFSCVISLMILFLT